MLYRVPRPLAARDVAVDAASRAGTVTATLAVRDGNVIALVEVSGFFTRIPVIQSRLSPIRGMPRWRTVADDA